NEVRGCRRDVLQCFDSVGGGLDHKAMDLELLLEVVDVQRFVVDDEDPRRRFLIGHRTFASPAATIGRSPVNIDPTPTPLSALTSPPSTRASRREMLSPSPVPRLRRACADSGRWNSSKIFVSSSGAMPMPLS